MEKTVYLLGAGFSAYAGLPVMNNFLEKAKDMFYLLEKDKYQLFSDVFRRIKELSVVKNYFQADLFNIEEILSILEMESSIAMSGERGQFVQFISDVIKYYSEPFDKPIVPLKNAGNWYDHLFGTNQKVLFYGLFVLSLFNIALRTFRDPITSDPILRPVGTNRDRHVYSVITLNYDQILERTIELLIAAYKIKDMPRFEENGYNPEWNCPHLAKLHGSVDKMNIVPPTWSKSITPTVLASWQNALQMLRACNHIRIIGYSLPISDSYIKYLLKSGIRENNHLKSIDVICLDSTGEVEKRYDDFIDTSFRKYFRFKKRSVFEYLGLLHQQITKPRPQTVGGHDIPPLSSD